MRWIPPSFARGAAVRWPPWSRIAVPISTALIGMLLISLLFLAAFRTKQSVLLFSGYEFTPPELVLVEAAFASRGLCQYSIDERGRVTLPKKRRSEFIAALSKSDAMPEHIGSELEKLFDGSRIFESNLQRQLRYRIAKQSDLSRIVALMDGIEESFVNYDVKTERGFHRRITATANVVIRPTSGTILNPERLNSIRQVVAGSVAELQPQDVTVTDLSTNLTYSGEEGESRSLYITDELFARKRRTEELWNQKISRLLEFIPDAGVVSNVELGYADVADANGVRPETEHRLVTKQLAVSVSVPSQYYQQMWEKGHPSIAGNRAAAPDKFEISRLRQRTELNVHDSIKGLYPAAKVQVISVQPIGALASRTAPRWFAWLARNSWIFTLSLGVVVAGMALWWLKPESSKTEFREEPAPPAELLGFEEPEPARILTPLAAEEAASVEEPTSASDQYDRGLTEVVRENPAAAANVLKDWLSKAG